MNRILRIPEMNHPGVLRDFNWPEDLRPFARFNLIYGRNGSGKTTLSRFLRALEHGTEPEVGRIDLQVGDRKVPGSAFSDANIPIKVFNRDFVNESVFPATRKDVPPIFVVGLDNVEKQKRLDALTQELSDEAGRLAAAKAKLDQAKRDLETYGTNQAKTIKETLRGTDSAFNNYDRRNYHREASNMVSEGSAESHRLKETDRDKLMKQHHERIKSVVAEVDCRIPNTRAIKHNCARHSRNDYRVVLYPTTKGRPRTGVLGVRWIDSAQVP